MSALGADSGARMIVIPCCAHCRSERGARTPPRAPRPRPRALSTTQKKRNMLCAASFWKSRTAAPPHEGIFYFLIFFIQYFNNNRF
jgi:hypothetical protein